MGSYSIKRIIFGAVFVLLLSGIGCGQNDWGYLSGTVRLDGEPVGPGSMSLERLDGERAGAVATFGPDGKYNVFSARRNEGAHAGEYRVMFFNSYDFKPAPGKIPAKYANPTTSDLTITVQPGRNAHDFDLKP